MDNLNKDNHEAMPMHQFAEKAYLDYSMYVILDRALPSLADGLKPVQRRIIYAMSELGLKSNAKYKKSARTIGDVLGKFHPHSDAACYEAMVLMAQSFSYRYPLVDGQGNWGSIDDPKSFAAMRYTEARLTAYAQIFLAEIDQGTCTWKNNFDATLKEPTRLPARLPNILLNGSSGIAVGMATDIPPHNLKEVTAACIALLKNPKTSIEELCDIIQGPDYPTQGILITNKADLLAMYKSGKGSVKLRAAYHQNKEQIIISQLPYQVTSTKVMLQIAEQMVAKKLPMLIDLQDQSDEAEPVRIVLSLKSQKTDIDAIMAHLFATTDLQKQYRINLNMINLNQKPKVMDLKEICQQWLVFRQDTVKQRISYQLRNIQERLHLIQGLLIAYLNLDQVIHLIRTAEDPKLELITRFELTELQATAILNIKLRQLAKLEQIILEREQKELSDKEKELLALLESDNKIKRLMAKELENDAKLYGDARKTILNTANIEAKTIIATVPAETITIVLSKQGWIRQAKGEGVDLQSLTFKAQDQLLQATTGKSNQILSVFDTQGKVYNLPIQQIPSIRGQGDPLTKFLKPIIKTKFDYLLFTNKTEEILLMQSNGYGFITSANNLICKNKSGKNIITIATESAVIKPIIKNINSDEESFVAIISSAGYLLIIPAQQIPNLNKGKGSILLKIPKQKRESQSETIVTAAWLTSTQSLKIHAGKRFLTLKPKDWQLFVSNKASRGQLLPRGFRQASALTIKF